MNALTVIAGVAAIVALYAVMFATVYLWSRHAPIFPSNGAYGLANVSRMLPHVRAMANQLRRGLRLA
jgi:hypothetical protein